MDTLSPLSNEEKFQSVRVVKNVRQFVNQWDKSDTKVETREKRVMQAMQKVKI